MGMHSYLLVTCGVVSNAPVGARWRHPSCSWLAWWQCLLARFCSPCHLPPLHGLTEARFVPCLLICLHSSLFCTFFTLHVHVSFVCVLSSVLLWSAHCGCSAVSHCQVCSMCLLLSRKGNTFSHQFSRAELLCFVGLWPGVSLLYLAGCWF